MRNGWERGARADAVVVGGGVVGLCVARELARRGLSVVLTERGRVGAEASWAAGGMLAPQAEADRPDAFFDLARAARDAYPAFAAELADETGADVELDQTGTLYLAFGEHDASELGRRFDWQRRAGLLVERLSAAEARAHEPNVSPRLVAALRFPRDWQVENRRLVAALALSARRLGVEIHEQTEALSVRAAAGRASGVETSRGTISAAAVVVAGGAWTSRLPVTDEPGGGPRADDARGETSSRRDAETTARALEPVRADDPARAADSDLDGGCGASGVPRVEPVRGQMLCYETAGAAFVRHVVYSPRGYLVPRRDGRLLAGSTTERAGFDKSVTPAGRAEIVAHAEEIAPALGRLRLADAWAGLRPRAADDWPVIGAHAEVENLFYATAHYRNGILLAPLTGRLVAALVCDAAPALAAPFSPARLTLAACAR